MTIEETSNTKKAAFETMSEGNNIENNIRDIVVMALKEGKMQPDEIKQTLNEVIEGACDGVNTESSDGGAALKQALTGVDSALGQVAEVSKLAIEEASGNVQEFSDHDLKKALTDLKDLESLLFDTLTEVANKGQETTSETLKKLLKHLQGSGSSVGQSVQEILSALHHDLSKDGRLQKIQLADVAKATGSSFARISSGLLAGIADSLEPKKK